MNETYKAFFLPKFSIGIIVRFILLTIFIFAFQIKAQGSESISRGKIIYESVCFACHGKNLEGAVGPNLKDSLWLHGASKAQLMTTIKKGFPEQGMVAFGTIYKDQQIEDISNFILSRQQGLRDMEYRIYHKASFETGVQWGTQKPDKKGPLNPPHVNLNLPEVDQFGLQFKGKLLIPQHIAGKFKIVGMIRQKEGFQLLIDGKKIELSTASSRFEEKINLSAGIHEFEFRYIRGLKSTPLHFELLGKATIPLSFDSYRKSLTSEYIVKAEDSFFIMRKRVKDLSPGTIIVNHQDQVSYAISPYGASVSAIWTGDSIDIGPNIYARGQDVAKTLGKHLLSKKEAIELLIDGSEKKLKYLGYANKPKPKFMYKYGTDQISIESSINSKNLLLTYSLVSQHPTKIQVKIPKGLTVNTSKGTHEGLVFTPDNSSSFQIIIPFEEQP
ncbi:cytochrome c [Lentisphaera profundi]|uniref:Cytochrome c n=1 Tax=Lentisphaera profundi TaxID=1658616 RepID=A0ABY7VSM3_9BACT|nr:cytochrome c [Lentisphaera profundi]WDE96901.1 cytochrome c [Lentisphaera profundi]